MPGPGPSQTEHLSEADLFKQENKRQFMKSLCCSKLFDLLQKKRAVACLT